MSFELVLIQIVDSFRLDLLTEVFVGLTALGSVAFAFVLISSLFLSGEKKFGKITAVAYGLMASTVYSLKFLVGRPRPEIADNLVHTATTHSFPSGHTASAFVLATMLCSKKPEMKYFFFGLAAIVGISRVYLGVHYPSDILVGGLIGIGAGKIMLKHQDKIVSLIRMGGNF